MKNNWIIFLTVFIMFGLLSFLIIRVPSKITQGAGSSKTWTSGTMWLKRFSTERPNGLALTEPPRQKKPLEGLKKQFAVQQLVQREIKENVKITPDDLRLYYDANKDKYVEETGEEGSRKKRQMTFEEAKSRVEQEYILRKQTEVTNSLVKKALEDQEVEIYAGAKNKKEGADNK